MVRSVVVAAKSNERTKTTQSENDFECEHWKDKNTKSLIKIENASETSLTETLPKKLVQTKKLVCQRDSLFLSLLNKPHTVISIGNFASTKLFRKHLVGREAYQKAEII